MVKARETLFHLMKGLSAFTKGNIVHENFKGMPVLYSSQILWLPALTSLVGPMDLFLGYCLDPATRYKQWRPKDLKI